jgi:hypothetical protein
LQLAGCRRQDFWLCGHESHRTSPYAKQAEAALVSKHDRITRARK